MEILKKIRSWINKIPTDKLLHFLCSFAIAAILYATFDVRFFAVLITAIIGLSKEYMDKVLNEDKKLDYGDLFADAVGILLWLICSYI